MLATRINASRTHFATYGDGFRHLSLEDLVRHQREEDDLLARAEYSGCESVYVEVARWSAAKKRWCRYCFLKLLDVAFEGDCNSELELAETIAGMINAATDTQAADRVFVHRLPNFFDDK
jgi:hypothetical protein